ncbi:cytochrome ubiquinol oxidase subunit I [Castellaniella sp. GW247-6E4]|uniref:cytochrome ubiquinol oxidase subunit I n=1 Tax=Castellaniella sp. GW247-6E4 TaxID=3140380 RepID=UPI0033159547
MTQTALFLSLAQFLTSLGFMLAFLALELGLAWVLLYLRLRARAGDASWMLAYRFWVRVYALSLILSFAAAIPVLIQLGTLWPDFMEKAGEVAGPLVAAAVLTAFVFKSCFLGAMLYGQRRLSDGTHTLTVFMVVVGASLTAYWIMAFMAWTQMPIGASLVDGRYQVRSWLPILGGRLAPTLFGLMAVGGLMVAAALMLAVTAVRTRTRPSDEGDRRVYATGVWLLLVCILAQAALVVNLGRVLMPAQPARAAAVVPQWHSTPSAELTVAAWPDAERQANDWEWRWPIEAPGWIARDPGGEVRGLDHFSGMTPPVLATYWTLRVALLAGALLALIAVAAWWRGWRLGHEPDGLRPLGRAALRLSTVLACVIQIAGFAHVFIGAMPYAIYGTVTLRELDAVTDLGEHAAITLAYVLVYAVLLLGFYQLLRHITRYGVVPVARRRGRA